MEAASGIKYKAALSAAYGAVLRNMMNSLPEGQTMTILLGSLMRLRRYSWNAVSRVLRNCGRATSKTRPIAINNNASEIGR